MSVFRSEPKKTCATGLIAAFVLQYLTGIRVVSTRRFNCVVHGTFRLALTDKVKKECLG
jgi:hypothetical protein